MIYRDMIKYETAILWLDVVPYWVRAWGLHCLVLTHRFQWKCSALGKLREKLHFIKETNECMMLCRQYSSSSSSYSCSSVLISKIPKIMANTDCDIHTHLHLIQLLVTLNTGWRENVISVTFNPSVVAGARWAALSIGIFPFYRGVQNQCSQSTVYAHDILELEK